MNLPNKCPFYGADIAVTGHGEKCVDETWVAFDCITSIHGGVPQLHWQSPTCKERERVQLLARVAELEARIKRLEEAGQSLFENSYPTIWDTPKTSAQKLSDQSRWVEAKDAKP